LAEIKSLAVMESMKGRGIGTALVQACLKEAKELGVKTCICANLRVGLL